MRMRLTLSLKSHSLTDRSTFQLRLTRAARAQATQGRLMLLTAISSGVLRGQILSKKMLAKSIFIIRIFKSDNYK